MYSYVGYVGQKNNSLLNSFIKVRSVGYITLDTTHPTLMTIMNGDSTEKNDKFVLCENFTLC